MAEITQTEIAEVLLIVPRRFGDHRGFFTETWKAAWALVPADRPFIQDNHAFSAAPNTLRGLHFQSGASVQAKLVRCVAGAILDVAVDIRRGSSSFGKVVARTLSAENGHQLLVPHGFAHGYQTLTPDAHVLYKVDGPYDPSTEGAVNWADPDIAAPWVAFAEAPALSGKDQVAPMLRDIQSPFAYVPGAPFNCVCEPPAPPRP